MKLHTTQRDLLTATKWATKAIGARSAMPVLDNVKLTANGIITMTGTDIDTTITGTMEGTTEGECNVLLPGKRLREIANRLEAGPVTLDIQPGRVTIDAGKATIELAGLPGDEFPLIRPFDGEPVGTLTESDVSRLRSAATVASTDEFRPAMCGVYLEAGKVVATDGFRLAAYTVGFDPGTPTIFPANSISALSMFTGEVEVGLTPTHAHFSDGTLTVTTRLIDEQYPNWQMVVPSTHETTVTLDRIELLSALRRVALASNGVTRSVDFEVVAEGLRLHSEDAESGSTGEEWVHSKVDGPPVHIRFNATFAENALDNHITAQTIELRLTTALKPVTIVDPRDPADALFLLMPIRRDK